jgi:hypothetical protein
MLIFGGALFTCSVEESGCIVYGFSFSLFLKGTRRFSSFSLLFGIARLMGCFIIKYCTIYRASL